MSGGITFYDPFTIQRFQICLAFKKAMNIADGRPTFVASRDVLHGNVDEWQEPLRVCVNFAHTEDEVAEIRRVRGESLIALENLTKRWRGETARRFEDRFREEGLSYGPLMLQRYLKGVAKYYQIGLGQLAGTGDELMSIVMSNAAVLMTSLLAYLPRDDDLTQHDQNVQVVGRFLLSDAMLDVPFNRIASTLWAGVAHRIASDAMRPSPNRGTVNDIDMASVLLPYCDAMLVDRDLQELLNYGPVRRNLEGQYGTKVFSLANREGLLEYLDELEAATDSTVLDAVRDVYGEVKPLTTMYEHERPG